MSSVSGISRTHSLEVSRWSQSRRKRLFDLCCAAPAIIAAAPVMLVIGALVRLTSSGPVIFRQSRCGLNGTHFELLKFRTMVSGSGGPGVTRAGDSRVTPLGRVLRKWKLDELPQFWNVLRGDLSLVGPRPDLPQYLDALRSLRALLLTVRPGITGYATLHYRNEEEDLAKVTPEQVSSFYVQNVLPHKALLDIGYAAHATLWTDIDVLIRTAARVVRPAVHLSAQTKPTLLPVAGDRNQELP